MSLPSARPGQLQSGFWGNHTGSIDWCETNYALSPYIAEFINTLSNVPTILLAFYGMYHAKKQKLPTRIFVSHAGIAFIGFGSIWFHATLSFYGQILDEIPMLFLTSILVACAFETSEGYNIPILSPLNIFLFIFDVGVSISCLLGLSPTIHEVGFGLLVTAATAGILYILKLDPRLPKDSLQRTQGVKAFGVGIASFLLGFAIWNADNLLCDQLAPIKIKLGYPFRFLLEGHAYWHLLTGLAAYLCIEGCACICLSLKEPRETFWLEFGFLGLPYLVRRSVQNRAQEERTRLAKEKEQAVSVSEQ